MTKKTFKVVGMDCESCAKMIELDLEDAGIKAECSFAKEALELKFQPDKITEKKIREVVAQSGYKLES